MRYGFCQRGCSYFKCPLFFYWKQFKPESYCWLQHVLYGLLWCGIAWFDVVCFVLRMVWCGIAWQGRDGMETTMGDTCQAPTPASAPEFGPALTFPHWDHPFFGSIYIKFYVSISITINHRTWISIMIPVSVLTSAFSPVSAPALLIAFLDA